LDFFARQERSRTAGRWLVVLFLAAVIGTVAAVDAVIWIASGLADRKHAPPSGFIPMTTLLVLAVILVATTWRVSRLSSGGAVVALDLGGTPVDDIPADPAMRRFRNVVEEIAIASGVPVPRLFVMQNEDGINAFAAGYSAQDAAICVTRGCLDQLDRDELQGVIAHEFSHVLNGDMRLNVRLMGLLFGILVLSIAGRRVISAGSGNSRGGWAVIAFGAALYVVGSIGHFFARLIQAGVARSRESLADASAVQFTRQTRGIAGALKKIAAASHGSTLQADNRREVAHMLFGEASTGFAWFATHPPLFDRIRALDPGFREAEIGVLAARMDTMEAVIDDHDTGHDNGNDARTSGLAGGAAVSARVGQVEAGDIARGATLRTRLPRVLVDAARGHPSALLAALTLSHDVVVRARQRPAIVEALGEEQAAIVDTLRPVVSGLDAALRLPLASMSLPGLRALNTASRATLVSLVDTLARADGVIDLFEYAVGRLLRAELAAIDTPRVAGRVGTHKLAHHRDAFARLCAIVARFGSSDDIAALRAWRAALSESLLGEPGSMPPPPHDWRHDFDAAIAELDACSPASKELIVRGLWCAIAADGEVTVSEAECLRTICAALGCPLPPGFVDEAC
jgi:Zn-dependent protease with chaperone function